MCFASFVSVVLFQVRTVCDLITAFRAPGYVFHQCDFYAGGVGG